MNSRPGDVGVERATPDPGIAIARREELRLLRLRAYGPAADIQNDPAALRRLHHLESRERATEPETEEPGSGGDAAAEPVGVRPDRDDPSAPARAPAQATPPAAAPATPVARPTARASDAPAAPDVRDPGAATASPATAIEPETKTLRPLRLRTRLAWIASVLIAGSVAASVTYASIAFAPVAVSHGARQIATLDPSTTATVPEGWFGAGPSSRVYEFFGLTLFETMGTAFGLGGDACVAAVATSQLPDPEEAANDWSVQGNVFSGCRVGTFPATIALRVDSSVPTEMRSAFPEGSALQFVVDGERIGVFLGD